MMLVDDDCTEFSAVFVFVLLEYQGIDELLNVSVLFFISGTRHTFTRYSG